MAAIASALAVAASIPLVSGVAEEGRVSETFGPYGDGIQESQTHTFVRLPMPEPRPESIGESVVEETPEAKGVAYGEGSQGDVYDESFDEVHCDDFSEDSGYHDGGYTNGVLTASGGVNWYNGVYETYYSQRVLPGGGLDIPGRHVAEDGTVRDGDGNIVVASDNLAYGSQVETSLGPGKVYDTGVGHGGIDIYTDW